MKDGLLDGSSVAKVLHDNSLEKLWRNAGVPDALRIDDDDGSASADAKAGRLSALHTAGAEQEVFALEQRCKE